MTSNMHFVTGVTLGKTAKRCSRRALALVVLVRIVSNYKS